MEEGAQVEGAQHHEVEGQDTYQQIEVPQIGENQDNENQEKEKHAEYKRRVKVLILLFVLFCGFFAIFVYGLTSRKTYTNLKDQCTGYDSDDKNHKIYLNCYDLPPQCKHNNCTNVQCLESDFGSFSCKPAKFGTYSPTGFTAMTVIFGVLAGNTLAVMFIHIADSCRANYF